MKFRYGFLFSSFVSLSLIGCFIVEKSSAGVVKPFDKVGAVHGAVITGIPTFMAITDEQLSQKLQFAADTNFETVKGKIKNSNGSVDTVDTTQSAEEWLNSGDNFYRCKQ